MPANLRFSQQSDEGYLSSTDRGRCIFEVGDNGPKCGRFALSVQSDISAISIHCVNSCVVLQDVYDKTAPFYRTRYFKCKAAFRKPFRILETRRL